MTTQPEKKIQSSLEVIGLGIWDPKSRVNIIEFPQPITVQDTDVIRVVHTLGVDGTVKTEVTLDKGPVTE